MNILGTKWYEQLWNSCLNLAYSWSQPHNIVGLLLIANHSVMLPLRFSLTRLPVVVIFTMDTNTKSFCYTPKMNTMLYVNYTSYFSCTLPVCRGLFSIQQANIPALSVWTRTQSQLIWPKFSCQQVALKWLTYKVIKENFSALKYATYIFKKEKDTYRIFYYITLNKTSVFNYSRV